MSTFAERVFATFKELRETHAFVTAQAFSGKDFASLFKKLSDDIYLYIFVHDGRSGNADLSISMWIAPPHAPGDGLDKLYVGFKLLIASAFDVDDYFFQSSQRRILSLIPYVHSLCTPILQELKSPAFSTQRYMAYVMERAAFEAMLNSKQARSSVESFINIAKGERVSYDRLEKIAIEAAKQVIEEGNLKDDVAQFFDSDHIFLGRSLVGLLYVYALT